MSENFIRNSQLFSEVYLREMRAAQTDFDVFEAARQTIGEWRQEYPDLSDAEKASPYLRQVLSTLDVAYSPREGGALTLFSDAAKEHATGLCRFTDDEDLGRAVKGRHHQVALVRELRAANLKWGLLTNGTKWRLCCAHAAAPYETFLEADLDGLLAQTQELADFAVFHRFFGGAAWSARRESTSGAALAQSTSGQIVSIGLDEWTLASEKRTEAIERHLKSRVESVLQRLCLGFVKHDGRQEYSREELDAVYQNAIYLLYRILFLFYAEARELLPIENPRYAPQSLRALVELAARRETEGVRDADTFSLWKRLTWLFYAVDEGEGALGVTAYNGGLFSDTEKPYLKTHRIGDEYLAPALFDLAFEATKAGAQPIDYRDLSVRHLGTLYEGLLEYKLYLVKDEPVVVRESKGKRAFVPQSQAGTIKRSETILETGEVYFADDKGERKASGSYYTPEDVVQYIVSNTIGPKLEAIRTALEAELAEVERERTRAATPQERERAERYGDGLLLAAVEEKLLTLKVLDPAMGSGHFLVAAGQALSDAIVETLNTTPWPNEEIETTPSVWKRRVVERCLYGVDKNPLAQELAKLSLWIISAARGKPLTFLDHHLKVGDSLLGTPLRRLGTLPPPPEQKRKRGRKNGSAAQSTSTSTGDLFAAQRDAVIDDLLEQMKQISRHDSNRVEDVKWKEEQTARIEQRAARLRTMSDLWLATLFGLQNDDEPSGGAPLSNEEWGRLLGEIAVNYAPEQWQTRVANSPLFEQAHEIAKREQFFHWELEFPDTLKERQCRFDCIIANPPYVGTKADTAIQELYHTAPCRDLYAWIMERAMQVLAEDGNFGTIVPLSLMFSRSFKTLRELILESKVYARFANFDNRPASIFGTTEAPNSQRATIALMQNSNSDKCRIYTTNLLRWSRRERVELMRSLSFTDVSEFSSNTSFPKFGDSRLLPVLREILNEQFRNSTLSFDSGEYPLYYATTGGYFTSASCFSLGRSSEDYLQFETEQSRLHAFVLLNSNVFYWWWRVFGDTFHITAQNVCSFLQGVNNVVPMNEALTSKLYDAADECRVSITYNKIESYNINFNKRMDILLEIDDWIVRHVAPDLELPRDIFAQYKSNSFLRPLDISALTGNENAGEEA